MKKAKNAIALGLCVITLLFPLISCDRGKDGSEKTFADTSESAVITTAVDTGGAVGKSEGELLSEAKEALALSLAPGDSLTSVTGNIVLPASGINGARITWRSSDPSVISESGTVVRPEGFGVFVTLTATVRVGNSSAEKVFGFFVLPVPASERDTTPPVIEGPDEITVSVGSTVSYRSQVTVTDDKDGSPSLEINADGVNLNQSGDYSVVYKATDSSGNTALKTVTVHVVTLEEAKKIEIRDQKIEEVITEIINDGMTSAEKGRAIFEWVYNNIKWAGTLSERGLVDAGYAAFTRRSGDCYIYYAAAKLLLDYCGIPNVYVERDAEDSHYWMLVDLGTGWYHFDASPKLSKQPYKAFMKTDEELETYAKSRLDGRTDYFKFDKSLYVDYPRQTEPFEG